MRRIAPALALLAWLTPAAAMELRSFRTPSDNIHCMYIADEGRNSVECELRERTNKDPALPKPADCDLEWGSRFALDEHGEAGMVCHGDTLLNPGAPVLHYGRSNHLGEIWCRSSPSGLSCRNPDGHGFTLSRAAQELF